MTTCLPFSKRDVLLVGAAPASNLVKRTDSALRQISECYSHVSVFKIKRRVARCVAEEGKVVHLSLTILHLIFSREDQ